MKPIIGVGFLMFLAMAACGGDDPPVLTELGMCGDSCGDGTCTADESCDSCPDDCGACGDPCGDGTCSADETCATCPADCGTCTASCGDGTCGADETCASCPADCGTCTATCGDGACNAGETCASCASDCGSCGGGLLFASGWDSTNVLGCTYEGLIDNAWEDYGGSGACDGAVHDADVVTDVSHDGGHALRVTQKPGNQNGTDFRIIKTFGDQSDVTILGWVYYSPNYRWAGADHKIFITVDAGQTAQNVYINYRGGSDPQHARLCAGITPTDSVYCASAPQVTVDTWYRIRAHIVGGAHGAVQLWLEPEGQAEIPLNLTYDAGTAIDINDVNTGGVGGFKYDTTYNQGSFIDELMYQYVDSIEVHSGLFGG